MSERIDWWEKLPESVVEIGEEDGEENMDKRPDIEETNTNMKGDEHSKNYLKTKNVNLDQKKYKNVTFQFEQLFQSFLVESSEKDNIVNSSTNNIQQMSNNYKSNVEPAINTKTTKTKNISANYPSTEDECDIHDNCLKL